MTSEVPPVEGSRSHELTFSARPEVWRALADAWYGETNRTSAADHRDAECLMGDIDEAAQKALALGGSQAKGSE